MKQEQLQKVMETYDVLLKLPGYMVFQHPQTFHTVVVCHKQYKDKELVEAVFDEVLPGLVSDPEVRIPAGMFREWVKKSKKKTSLAPPPRDNQAQQFI